jgi:epsilon-lactone hydrolase
MLSSVLITIDLAETIADETASRRESSKRYAMLRLSSTAGILGKKSRASSLSGDTMKCWLCAIPVFLVPLIPFSRPILAQEEAPQSLPREGSSYTDHEGRVYVTRIVPVPQTISPEAQQSLVPREPPPKSDSPQSIQTRQMASDATRAVYPAKIEFSTLAGVPVSLVTPLTIPIEKASRLLINLHGGGFRSDSGSLTESLPLANLTQTKVVSVLYRLSPDHPFPAPIDDVIAVYKDLLKTHRSTDIGIYGSSAGAILTAEVAVKIKQLGLPLPGALGVFSGGGDFSKTGDSQQIYGVQGLSGHPDTQPKGVQWLGIYVGSADPKDPVLSPSFADLHGMPPTLFMTSTRDFMLSDTTLLHRAFLRAGVEASLVVFEGLNHCFWYDPNLPESREADDIMSQFFDAHLGTK